MNKLESTVTEKYTGTKIVDYLKREMQLSVSLVKKVKFGGVFINGENVHMRALVTAGDTVTFILPEEASEGIRPIEMPLDIIYEDEYLIAVNKPSDMPTHPSRGNSLPTLAEGLMAYFKNKKFVFRSINRLDRGTSGIVIVAKNAFVANKLSLEMKRGGFLKKYSAIVKGIPNPEEATIDAPIDRIEEGNIKRAVIDGGKRAITDYKVIRTYNDGNSLLEITLHTGRTHQIRVHMSHIGHPLVGDFLYGECDGYKNYFLHAKSIEISHPISGERLILNSKENFNYDSKDNN